MNIKVIETKLMSDCRTPVEIYLKVRDRYPKCILLELKNHQHQNRSIIGIAPIAEFIVEHNRLKTTCKGNRKQVKIEQRHKIPDELQRFIDSFNRTGCNNRYNGFYGYFAYDAIEYFDTTCLKREKDKREIPDIYYCMYRFLIIINHETHELTIVENLYEGETAATGKVKEIIERQEKDYSTFSKEGEEIGNMDESQFRRMVKTAKKHCKRGDVFQLVISRRFSQRYKGDEFIVYRQLRSINPSPFHFYYDYGNFKIFGSSPELLVEITDNKASINPIAGTYARPDCKEKEQLHAAQLAEDPKENAEHTMLVDLARNDLSKNSNRVEIEFLKELHTYSHVIHIVSRVTGKLEPEYKPVRIIADTFPAGTLTGAPKHKAIELIDRYEPTQRGYYGGSIGFIGFKNDSIQAITIRTFLSQNCTIYYQAGAGITVNSDEENELQEIYHKLKALRIAINRSDSCNR